MNPCFSTIYEAAKKYNACIEGLRAIETAKDESDYISHRDIRVFAYWITTKEPELATVRKEYNEHIMKSMKKLDEIIVPSSGSSAEIHFLLSEIHFLLLQMIDERRNFGKLYNFVPVDFAAFNIILANLSICSLYFFVFVIGILVSCVVNTVADGVLKNSLISFFSSGNIGCCSWLLTA